MIQAYASAPSVADLDAQARATGNRKDIAVTVGDRLFTDEWPAQVMQVSANEMAGHVVLGLRVSGVHFHKALTREAFLSEIASLVARSFAAAPMAEEVDVWAVEPLNVGKGLVVAGDLAVPTSRTVFTLTARRSESPSALAARLRSGQNVYVNEDWAHDAFKKGS
jgi:hypothetical protein